MASHRITPTMRSHRRRARRVASKLETWFRGAARALPWRQRGRKYSDRGYRVWVSEVMLQQTQVQTVVPYYERWMRRLPTLPALAEASEEEVLSLWSGLGYYRRARNLHLAAQMIVAEHGGALPREARALRALPGIGRYSAGAIASLAFGAREPIVDGNVARVISRLEAWRGDPSAPPLSGRLWTQARALVEASDSPGQLNEALMELGALLCTPRAPCCTCCPLKRFCRALAAGDPLSFPGRLPARARPTTRAVCAVIADRRGAFLLGRRRPGLLGGLWEPPLLAEEGRLPPSLTPRGEIRHIFTHLELYLQVLAGRVARRAEVPRARPDTYEAMAWVRDPESLALSALARKALAAADLFPGRRP